MANPYLISFQLSWAALGLAYNVASWFMIQRGAPALAPTDPLMGAGFVLVYAGFILAGLTGKRRGHKAVLPVLTVALVALGVVPHLIALSQSPDLPGYASTAAWGAALGVNTYGAGVFLASTWIAYRRAAPD